MNHPSPASPAHHARAAFAAGLTAYVLWGFLPLLFHALRDVPPLELVAWRVVFTLPVCLVFVTASRGWGDLAATLRRPDLALRLVLSALFIGTNWILYVNAVIHGHVLATSLGYYINPLLNVLIGTAFLGERLSWRQWSAVVIAGVGIALLLAGAIQMLGIALELAASFALYGLMRKTTPVTAITGLTVETLLLFPVAAVWAWIVAQGPHGSSMAQGGLTSALLASSGLITAIPLILFAFAARNLALSMLGFMQFAAPTIVFLIGVFVIGEPLDPLRLACFVLIWIAVALFIWDTWRRTRYL
jgi:chloramphenicol-sensitive protein RarD